MPSDPPQHLVAIPITIGHASLVIGPEIPPNREPRIKGDIKRRGRGGIEGSAAVPEDSAMEDEFGRELIRPIPETG